MEIPKIIHQTWKSSRIPRRWRKIQAKNILLHPEHKYILWTDEEMDSYVKNRFSSFHSTYRRFSHNIFRADVFRYLIMYSQGGIYLDLDYELLVPFSETTSVVLPQERSLSFGDHCDRVGNCFFASVPGHTFWKDAIDFLELNFPSIRNEFDAAELTGPMFLQRMLERKPYPDIYTPERMVYNPPGRMARNEYHKLTTNGITKGIHYGWGSWKERTSWHYWKRKITGR